VGWSSERSERLRWLLSLNLIEQSEPRCEGSLVKVWLNGVRSEAASHPEGGEGTPG
jgi:hypothetical protein